MNEDLAKKTRQSAVDRLISSLLPGNENPEVEERFRKMFLGGKLDERRIEITFSNSDKKTMSVKEVYELLYKEEYEKLQQK